MSSDRAKEGQKPAVIIKEVHELTEDELSGIVDNGLIRLRCDNCRALVAEVWSLRPDEPETWNIRATCPWCFDPKNKHGHLLSRSSTVTVRGGWHYGGIGVPRSNRPDDDIGSTAVPDVDFDGDPIILKVAKYGPDAKPVYDIHKLDVVPDPSEQSKQSGNGEKK